MQELLHSKRMLYTEIKCPIFILFSTDSIFKKNVRRPNIFRFNGIIPYLWNLEPPARLGYSRPRHTQSRMEKRFYGHFTPKDTINASTSLNTKVSDVGFKKKSLIKFFCGVITHKMWSRLMPSPTNCIFWTKQTKHQYCVLLTL